jgi:hypothetical protein
MISISNFGHIDYGRFGNQIFQYALAKILATEHECDFYLNPSTYFIKFFDSSCLTYKPLSSNLNLSSYIESNPYGFDEKIYNQDNIDLIGFFQNLSYYNKFWNIIQKELIPNHKCINDTVAYLKSQTKYTLDLEESICIHFRRTDYTVLQNKYGLLTTQYYSHIINNYIHKYKHIFIISDDTERVKTELSGTPLGKSTHLIQGLDAHHDFYIMYLSRINLIANSTFSWWASLLGSLSNQDKQVFIPFPWLPDTNKEHSTIGTTNINLYPSTWYKVNTNNINWEKLFI